MPNLPNVREDADRTTVPEDVKRHGPRRWEAIDPDPFKPGTGDTWVVSAPVGVPASGTYQNYFRGGNWFGPDNAYSLSGIGTGGVDTQRAPYKPAETGEELSPDELLIYLARKVGYL